MNHLEHPSCPIWDESSNITEGFSPFWDTQAVSFETLISRFQPFSVAYETLKFDINVDFQP